MADFLPAWPRELGSVAGFVKSRLRGFDRFFKDRPRASMTDGMSNALNIKNQPPRLVEAHLDYFLWAGENGAIGTTLPHQAGPSMGPSFAHGGWQKRMAPAVRRVGAIFLTRRRWRGHARTVRFDFALWGMIICLAMKAGQWTGYAF